MNVLDFTPLLLVIAAMLIAGVIGLILRPGRGGGGGSGGVHPLGSESSVQYFGDRTGSGGQPPETEEDRATRWGSGSGE